MINSGMLKAFAFGLLLASCIALTWAFGCARNPGPVIDPNRSDSQPNSSDGLSPPEQDSGADAEGDTNEPLLDGAHQFFGNVVPVSTAVADNLRAIASRDTTRNRRVLMKVGDSITVNCNSFCCFAPARGKVVDLGGRTALQGTIDHFNGAQVGGEATSSWDRKSLAARAGVLSTWPLKPPDDGSAAPLFEEIEAINPGFAIIMLGTNDNSGGTFAYYLGPRAYRTITGAFVSMVDELTRRGIVPVISYIPPVFNEEARSWLTPAINAVLRGVATAKLIPTIDYYTAALEAIPDGWGGDGVHPLPHPTSACLLTKAGLAYGYNVRNLVSLEVLDKIRQAVVEKAPSVDPEPEPLLGDGTIGSPVQVPRLPFSLPVSFNADETSELSDYSACGLADPANGSERIFRLAVSEATPIRAIVAPSTGKCKKAPGESDNLCGGSRDVGLALFEGIPGQGRCLAWDTTRIERWLPAGTYHFVVDSFSGSDKPDYAVFSVHACHPNDIACKP